ncbi:MAG: outer membrane protein assembly factor BamA [Deltaproteobacteria bacterium]|nr:outer membrane protein assembly factor BamA [Deltaproteobacteria bacterium]
MKKYPIVIMMIVLALATLASAKSSRMAVAPFTIQSQEDLGYLSEGLQDMISNQLQQKGFEIVPAAELTKASGGKKAIIKDEAQALALGRRLNLDYVMFGSLTKIGKQVSLDARMVDVTGAKKTVALSAQEESIDKLSVAVEKITREIAGPSVAGPSVAGTAVAGPTATGPKVAKVLIEGQKRIEPDAIKRVLQTQPGDVYSEQKVSEDLRRVFEMSYFEDVRVDAEDTPQGKVIKFTVEEKPAIVQIDFNGNVMLDRDALMGALGYHLYAIMDDQKMKESVDGLKKLYREKGYYKADIKYTTETQAPKTVAVKYVIDEGSRLYVKSIEFIGNKEFSSRQLRGQMEIKERWFLSWITDSGILKQDILKDDVTRLMSFYLNNGYIKAKVGDPDTIIEDDGLILRFPIEEGPQFKVGKVSIEGDLIFPEETVLQKLKITKEEVYNQDVARKDLKTVKEMYADEGYAYNLVTPKMKEHPENQTVDVAFFVEKKNLVSFERIDIVGNDKTQDKVIRRELKIVEGEQFSGNNMRQSLAALNRLGYFEDVQLNTADGSSEDKMNIKVELKERPTGAFSVGAGYSSYNSVFGLIRISQDNLWGTGRKLTLQGSMGAKADEYILSYTDPWLFDMPLMGGFDVFYKTDTFSYYSKSTTGAALRAGFPLFEEVRLSARYLYQKIKIYDIDPAAAQLIQDMQGWSTSSSVSAQLRRDTRDRLFNPTSGSDNSLTVSQTGGILGGTLHYTEYVADSGWFIPTFWEGWTVFLRGKAGELVQNKKNGLPIYEKYYLGGMNSIRGYNNWSIAPTDPTTGDTIGGTKMIQFNAELIFPLIKEAGMMGVVFYDMGDAYDKWSLSNLRRSYGGGIRYYSPMGPLRLEYGAPLDRKQGDPSGRWEFAVGTFF